jgi:hypothetical protein
VYGNGKQASQLVNGYIDKEHKRFRIIIKKRRDNKGFVV